MTAMSEERRGEDQREDRRRPAWADLHLWQMQPVRDVLVGLGVFGLLILGQKLSLVTVPLLLALLFAYLFEPLIVRLERVMSRRFATSSILFLSGILVVVPFLIATGFAILQASTFAGDVAQNTKALAASLNDPESAAKRERVAELGGPPWLKVRETVRELQVHAELHQRLERTRALGQEPSPEDLAAEEEALEILGIDSRLLTEASTLLIEWVRQNSDVVSKQVVQRGTNALTVAVSTLVSFGYFGFGLFLTAFFFFFIASSWRQVVDFLHEFVPAETRPRFTGILEKMDRAIHGFIRGRLTISFFLGIFYTVGFWFMGVPAPLFLGPAVAVITLIPYAAMLAIPVVIVLMWLEGLTGFRGTTWWILGAPVVYYNLGQALDDYVLTPLIQGKSTDLETPTILFASIAGGVLFGFYGLLLAIPLAACVKILLREVFWPRFQAWSEGRAEDFLPVDRES